MNKANRNRLATISAILLVSVLLMAALGVSSAPSPKGALAPQGSAQGTHPSTPVVLTEDGRSMPAPRLADAQPFTEAVQTFGDEAADNVEAALLVRRHPEIEPAAFGRLLRAQGYTEVEGLLVTGWWRVVPAEGRRQADAEALASLPQVAEVVADRRVSLPKREIEWLADTDGVAQAWVPDDPYLDDQWGLDTAQFSTAWSTVRGTTDVWVAVIDTGIDASHPDRPANLLLGWDYVGNDDNPRDEEGHGTHVAGIVGARTYNGVGIAGACPDCGVLVVRVLNAGGEGWDSDIAEGIAYAAQWGANEGKRTIINLSLGGPYSSLEASAVSQAQALGALVVAAAGNDGAGAPAYPAAFSGVLAVSATDSWDWPTTFSQFGDLAAPGADILSTAPVYLTPWGYEPYVWGDGTSQAAPLASGVAALVWSLYPHLGAPAVAQALLQGADLPTVWDTRYGVGRLNAAGALGDLATATPSPSPSRSPSARPTATITRTPTRTPTPGPSPTPRPSPTYAPIYMSLIKK